MAGLAALPVLIAIATMIAAAGKWIFELAIVYGKKVVFFGVVVGLFFSVLYGVSTALFASFDALGGSSYFANVSPYLGLATAVFPANFLPIAALIISIEFQIFFWRWAMKVLDLKVNFFG